MMKTKLTLLMVMMATVVASAQFAPKLLFTTTNTPTITSNIIKSLATNVFNNKIAGSNAYIGSFTGNGAGLTNLPVAAQVWTNDGTLIYPPGFSPSTTNWIQFDAYNRSGLHLATTWGGPYAELDLLGNNGTDSGNFIVAYNDAGIGFKVGTNGSVTASGVYTGNGSGLTNLSRTSLANVAYLDGTNTFTGTNVFTAGTRTFRHDSSATIITNTATLTGTEFSAGQRKDWYNGAVTTTLDKTNGNISLAGALQVNGNQTNNGYLVVTNTTSASPSGMTGIQLYGGSTGVNGKVIDAQTNGVSKFSVTQSGSVTIAGNISATAGNITIAGNGSFAFSSGPSLQAVGNTIFAIDSSGNFGGSLSASNIFARGIVYGTNGIASLATAASIAISSTGWTNSYSVNAVVDFDAGAADLQWYVKNSAGTGVYTNTAAVVRHAETILQPGGALVITAGTSPSGTARQF